MTELKEIQITELDEISAILAKRCNQHGDFTDNANITQDLKRRMRNETQAWILLTDVQKEALEMIVHKIGRILAGNPNHKDHWHDIAGYAKLVADRIKEE